MSGSVLSEAAQTVSTSPVLASRRLVVKIGSALLVDDETGKLHQSWLDALCDDIAAAHARGQEVLIVTSGAIAIGRGPLGMVGRKLRLEEKQAAAATGQMRLTQAYQNSLDRHGLTVAQVLITLDDTENRRRYLNARNTLDTLLRLRAVPVINENDSVATAEIRFGDNDRLAARVAQMISADTLVLLSDIDGLYTADPRVKPDAQLVPEVREVTPEIEAMAGVSSTGYGSGGMTTKIMVALGENDIKTMEDLAGCATDDLTGWSERKDGETTRHPGALDGFEMTREDAEGLIMQARVKAGWITEADLAQPAEAAAEAETTPAE